MTRFADIEGRSHLRSLFALSMLLCAACTGTAEQGPDRPGGFGGANVTGSTASATGGAGSMPPAGAAGAQGTTSMPGAVMARCQSKAVSPSPMRRLTHAQYDNAVRDLLGDTTRPASEFAKGTEQGIFDTMADQAVAPLLADQYLDAAEALVARVTDLKPLVGCDPAGASATSCVREFVKRFARRAFQRPLATAELDTLIALYDKTRLVSDAATGVRAVLTAVLVSPNFLFRPEFGAQVASVPMAKKLTPFEQSARLSWLFWSSLPDDALLDAAAAGQLETRDQLVSQARRLFKDQKARAGVTSFYTQWFGLELLETTTKDAAVYPTFNDALKLGSFVSRHRYL